MTDIDNTQDVIDSRDIIERIDELTELCEVCSECGARVEADAGATSCACGEGEAPIISGEDEDRDELTALRDLASQCEGSADWVHGEALIRDSFFETYARELAEDIGSIAHGQPWPICHIDWQRAAEALQVDYTAVDYDGVTYWIRA